MSFSIVNSSKKLSVSTTMYKNPKPEEIQKLENPIFTAIPHGFLGPIGPPGLHGPKGEKGEKGETGEKGEKGEKGCDGKQGANGFIGPPGGRGLPGLPGPPRDIVYSVNIENKLGDMDNMQFTNNAMIVGNNISIPEIGKVSCLGGHFYRLCVKWQDNRESIDGEISWSTVDNVIVGTKIGVVANGILETIVNPSEDTTYILKKVCGNFKPEKEYSYVIIECLK